MAKGASESKLQNNDYKRDYGTVLIHWGWLNHEFETCWYNWLWN